MLPVPRIGTGTQDPQSAYLGGEARGSLEGTQPATGQEMQVGVETHSFQPSTGRMLTCWYWLVLGAWWSEQSHQVSKALRSPPSSWGRGRKSSRRLPLQLLWPCNLH